MRNDPLPHHVVARFIDAAGPGGALIAGQDDLTRYLTEWRGLFDGVTPLVLRPARVSAVAAIVRVAQETQTGLVPQGGNTGLVGGQIPDRSGAQVVVSLERLNTIREIDALNNTMTVDAGCTLQTVQDSAADHGRLFPLSLASEGSCQIGGAISTNAGGTAVLRYGSMRDLLLGLEAVLPNGEVWNGLTRLRKDNTGYNLTQLLAGAEGTLGIITGAVVKLSPAPKSTETAFAAIPGPQAAVELLAHLQQASGGLISTFEIISRGGLDLVLRHFTDTKDPFTHRGAWYVLAEATAGTEGWLRGVMEAAWSAAMEAGLISDAVRAESEAQRRQLWALRENMSAAQKREGASIKHDVSVPVSSVPAFLDKAVAGVEAALPGIRPVPFGHIGDGNIHFNLSQPVGMDPHRFLAQRQHLNDIVHAAVASFGGSISAEHGIGALKRHEIARYKPPAALNAMRAIKTALDPNGIMNPGKLL